ncbi:MULTISPECIES: hypothetical protein [Pectobacterium]|uniref:Uncharacterized protein n=1 Tax=Pectobacterium aquaticum TaxID=2204145 RepID=A0A3R8PBX8_9GAMM|nr:hypothetical protein [Pectobacterium aquaticum]RRO01425.1 hypothetical protein DMB85_020795 [Pectobacterium aquaticum]
MLTVLIYVLLGLAAAHYVYERIILPSIRLHYRNKLFELRDAVRDEIIANKSELDKQAANLVHDALNNAINRLHMMTLQNRIRAQRNLNANPALRAQINREIELFKKCDNKEINRTINNSADILRNVLFFNNLMMLIYLSPILLAIGLASTVVKTASTLVFQLRERRPLEEAVLLLPDRQVSKLKVA